MFMFKVKNYLLMLGFQWHNHIQSFKTYYILVSNV